MKFEDIANALSKVCRYGGHCREFYSVAEHSVLVAQQCPPSLRRAALMHDATEAYLGDMVRPLKEQMWDYRVAEARVWREIAEAFQIDPESLAEIKPYDKLVTRAEIVTLMRDPQNWGISSQEVTPIAIRCLSPHGALEVFCREWEAANR